MNLDIFRKEEISDKKEAKELCMDIDAYENIKKNKFYGDFFENRLEDVKEKYSQNLFPGRLAYIGKLSGDEKERLFTAKGKVTEKHFYLGERFPVSKN